MKAKEKITKEIELPENIAASFNGQLLVIKGPKGEVKRQIKHHNIFIKIYEKKIIFESKGHTKENKKTIGSLAAHLKNMVKGSAQGHTYILKICSGHFPMNVSVSGKKLVVKNFLGEKVPRVLDLKEGVDVKVEGDMIRVTSLNKEIAGQASADIEQMTRRPGYDTRIFQDGIHIINKDGKELK
ncbi:50S ribosomal protein L6 [Candidatus Woesearchaeota archaeon]|nr:50S ribosomal protein L6 [Candidatus Woesearchaeota archaeon]